MTTSAVGTRTWSVGDEIPPLVVGRITRATLALFAGGSGDHNPIHLDLDVARASGMDDVFAQGMLSMAYLGRLLTDQFAQQGLVSLSTRFVSLTPVNAEPTCFGVVTDVTDGLTTVELRVGLADGTVTLTGLAVISSKGTSA